MSHVRSYLLAIAGVSMFALGSGCAWDPAPDDIPFTSNDTGGPSRADVSVECNFGSYDAGSGTREPDEVGACDVSLLYDEGLDEGFTDCYFIDSSTDPDVPLIDAGPTIDTSPTAPSDASDDSDSGAISKDVGEPTIRPPTITLMHDSPTSPKVMRFCLSLSDETASFPVDWAQQQYPATGTGVSFASRWPLDVPPGVRASFPALALTVFGVSVAAFPDGKSTCSGIFGDGSLSTLPTGTVKFKAIPRGTFKSGKSYGIRIVDATTLEVVDF